MSEDVSEFFWDSAKPLLREPGVTRGSMMGYPCLRVDGLFFAACERHTGDLVVKLPSERVRQLIADDDGLPFAPGGHPFREWVRVPERDSARWNDLLDEARRFVSLGT